MAGVRGLSAALLGLGLACGAAAAGETRFEATVTRVSDGDTVWVQPLARADGVGRKRLRVRLVGLDAPERCQAHGEASRAALERLVQGQRVTVRRRARDEHGRALGTLWLGGEDVGARMVREGHAWSARWRGDAGPYAEEEGAARDARRGLFARTDALEPRAFRRLHGPCDPPQAR